VGAGGEHASRAGDVRVENGETPRLQKPCVQHLHLEEEDPDV